MKYYLSLVLIFSIIAPFPGLSQNTKKVSGVYQHLLDEGWHRKEINQLMQDYSQTSSGLPSKLDYPNTPQPKPNFDQQIDIDQIHNWADQYYNSYEEFENTFPEAATSSKIINADKIEPNKKINRQKGVWKHVAMYSTAGRIYDLELHPENKNIMYANPDGDGIFKTTDGGLHWSAITDNIPDRLHRNSHENIIVDPANFDHVFSISRFGNMYETKNSGKTWEKIINSAHNEGKAPQFKWVEAFRNSSDELVIIGTVTKNSGLNHGWNKGVYRSVNKGINWTKLEITDEDFQEMAFHKIDKDFIYLASRSKIYVSENGGESFQLQKDFQFGDRPIFISTLSKTDADALYIVASKGDKTQVHFSSDKGITWELRQDSENNIGFEKGIFGGHGSSGWTSFFEVDPFDKNHLIASNVASAESFDGGQTWEVQSWSTRALAQKEDGTIGMSPFGSHNADNHVLKFHPNNQGFKVKGCDAGIMMKEKADTNWVNINGNMPAFLWYSVVVNEFGDRYIAGNTQDVNIQTYRYNSWENDRGYEGDAIFMNPSTNTSYYPVAKTEEGEGLNFLEPGFWKMHSWSYPKVAPNYKNLDQIYIAFGRRPSEPEKQLPKYLYVTNNRGISFEIVPNMDDKEVFSVNVSRTKNTILTAFTATDVMISEDEGTNWEIKKYPENFKGSQNKRKVSGCVDPNKPSRMWVGANNGEVYQSENGGESWQSIKGALPKGQVLELIYHEGTGGDLYALIKGYGVFYRADDSNDWELWMDGFNLADFTEIRIDYPTQKLLASSYGRGLWEADLEKTVDRFGAENFVISAKGKVNNKFVYSLETDFQIPAYYNYNWSLNGERLNSNSNVLLLDKVKDKDQISVELVPIYSSDVSVSLKHSVEKTEKYKSKIIKEKSLFLNDKYIDLGIMDLFGAQQNFTISTWIKPITPGIIAANRRTFYRDAKGWYLEVQKDGKLNFNAAFYQNRTLSKTFKKGDDQSLSVISSDSVVTFNTWTHICVVVNRNSSIQLFVNNKQVATESIKDIPVELSLNNVMNLTLLADSYGKKESIGEFRNFSVFSKALSFEEQKQILKKGATFSKDLVYHLNFQNSNPLETKELFSKKVIQLKGESYLGKDINEKSRFRRRR